MTIPILSLVYFLPITFSPTHSVLAYDILIVPMSDPLHLIAFICPRGLERSADPETAIIYLLDQVKPWDVRFLVVANKDT